MLEGLLLDMDGVLYDADVPIEGAAEAVGWFQRKTIPHLFVTNTTSRTRSGLVQKLARMGIETQTSSILTPCVAAAAWLRQHAVQPIALFVPESTEEEFAGLPQAAPDASVAAAVVVGDLGERWTYAVLNRAFRLLMANPTTPLIALGMTRYWQAPDGLRLDVAPFVTALQDATGRSPLVLGKPDPAFFHRATEQLSLAPEKVCMVGDDVCVDVRGAEDAGLQGVLVRTGKYRPADVHRPGSVVDSIADLPAWWNQAQSGSV